MDNVDKKNTAPALRFPEFNCSAGWSVKPLCEVLEFERPDKFIVDTAIDYKDGIPVLTANKSFILGYTQDCVDVYTDLPVIIFDDFTTDKKFVDFPFKIRSSAIKILSAKHNDILRFIYELMNQIIFDEKEHKRYYISVYQKIKVPIPERNEQKKIAECLSSLDELIDATAKKVEALKEHKKGLMQRLFPSKGKNVPDLRFPEFSSDPSWKIEKFARYIKLFRGSSPRPIKEYLTESSDGINWIKIGDTQNAKSFILSDTQCKITKEGAEKSRYVYDGELILANSMSFGKTYQLAVSGCIYDGWFVLRGYDAAYHKQFLLQLLNSDYMQNQYEKLSAGGVVQNISSEIVYQTDIPITTRNEQKKITDCLSSIDELIEATSQKVEALKEHKKGLMQQLFPKI